MLILPMVSIAITAMGDGEGLLWHLLETIFFRYLGNTIILMLGVGLLALVFGVSTAWIVSRYEFPGRRWIGWMLLLPAAIPSYIIAYVYTDFLDYSGPVQTVIRSTFGYTNMTEYWFPDIRSLSGAIFVMGVVLYPYVYLMTRSGFSQIPARLFEVTLMSGRSLFWVVALPLGRPAIIAGLALVLMEVVADFGTVDFFAVETLSLGIYNVWLGMNNMTTAAQLALMAFALVFILLGWERYGRRNSQFSITNRSVNGVPRQNAQGYWRWILPVICLVPVILGFVLPVGILIFHNFSQGFYHFPVVGAAISHTVIAAGLGVCVVMICALIVGVIAFYIPSAIGRPLASVSATGYAFPGTVLALGVLAAVSMIDQGWNWIGQTLFGVSWGGLLGGGLVMLIFAYLIRFQAVGLGSVRAALERMPDSLVPASRVMGYGFMPSMFRIVLPLISPAILAGGLLVFVDIMKELPMTLLLRPFDFNTLAIITYQYAHDELIELAALPALMIVLTGLLPVIIVHHYLIRDQ
jgi:iron(III) transport system permease protein